MIKRNIGEINLSDNFCMYAVVLFRLPPIILTADVSIRLQSCHFQIIVIESCPRQMMLSTLYIQAKLIAIIVYNLFNFCNHCL